MKKFIVVFIWLFIKSTQVLPQGCDKLLEGGLYSFTKMTNTGTFNQDLRTYYLSDQFKVDLESGKWGGSVTIPIEGLPVTIGMNFNEDTYKEFKQKILSTSQLNISESFYKTSFSSIPNTNLYDSYVECIRITSDVSKSGFIPGMNIETEDIVVFSFFYRPQAPGDAMPIVSSFTLQPDGNVISGELKEGQTLNSFSFLITCKRDPEKDLVLSLETNRGLYVSKSTAEGAYSSSKELPIGTIITSSLNFEQFSFATRNNEKSPGSIWTASKSKWAPCDGRPIPNSKYSKLASQPNSPDLRGLFLRGLNSFDPNYTVQPADPTQLNPENSSALIYEPDAFKKHTHKVIPLEIGFSNLGNDTKHRIVSDDGPSYNNLIINQSTDDGGGKDETRPKNISIYYYIKIN